MCVHNTEDLCDVNQNESSIFVIRRKFHFIIFIVNVYKNIKLYIYFKNNSFIDGTNL